MSGGAAWYDITSAFGVSPGKAKQPMTEERAAVTIQKAYKKWLVRWLDDDAPEKDLTSFFPCARAWFSGQNANKLTLCVPQTLVHTVNSLRSPSSSAAHHPPPPTLLPRHL